MIISRTPYRISFFGGGTDYPVWFREHGGAVLGTTIDKYCYISVKWLPPFFEEKYRLTYSTVERAKNLDEIQHPSARECLRFLRIHEGVAITHDGDLPARRGMGTSSAFTVGLLNALHTLQGKRLWKEELANEAFWVEQQLAKETVGCQDQIFAAFGGFNHTVFREGGTAVSTARVPNAEELEKYLMLFDSGTSRTASDIAKKQVEDIGLHVKELEEMEKLVEIALQLLRNQQFLGFGHLLNGGWHLKKRLSPWISTTRIDAIYESAFRAGALGGKLLGAGAGGFLLFFVVPEKQEKVKKALEDLVYVPFRFDNTGSQIIYEGS